MLKSRLLYPLGCLLFTAAAIAWLSGGVQVYYKNSYAIQKVDEITGLTFEEQVEAFLPGGETLLLGFSLLLGCILLASILERRSSDS